MSDFPYVGKRMTIKEFSDLVEGIKFDQGFNPSFITLHHTGAPSLAQRPTGFSIIHLANLRHYYEFEKKWSGGPHIFVDDQEGVIVFQRLNRRGVHAVAFNRNSIGIEMLGNYDLQVEFNSSRRTIIFEKTAEICNILNKKLGAKPESIRFHNEDPHAQRNRKTCPGRFVNKKDFIQLIKKFENASDYGDEWSSPKFYINYNNKMFKWSDTRIVNNRTIVPVRPFLTKLGGHSGLVRLGNRVNWFKGIRPYSLGIADFDENGSAWVYLRDLCNLIGATFEKI